MRVLILHNRYRRPGGEDRVAGAEAELLRANGVDVARLEVDNSGVLLRLGLGSSWSNASYRDALTFCRAWQPHVAHVHNFWMKLSPSVHAACRASGSATVQTLHNFRLLCANALFLREGKVCVDCLGKIPWRGVVHRCYRGSALASAAVAGMMARNRLRQTWERDVDAFIALTESSKALFVEGGLPRDRILVKPNFVADPGPAPAEPSASRYVLYAGRLSPEKGLQTLLAAWALAALPRDARLLIAGDGPQFRSLKQQAASLGLPQRSAALLGHQSRPDILRLMAAARAVVLPSVWFEAFPVTVVEALSLGRPLIVSDLGSLRELVHDGVEGLTFCPGDPSSLSVRLTRLFADSILADRLGRNARSRYLAAYDPLRNFRRLMGVYRFAIQRRGVSLPETLREYEPAEVGV